MNQREDRLGWLDGVRGAAAMFVVLHHIWMTAWPYFPDNRGPWWVGLLLYGHLAVAVFIVVSGFSLALAPMRNGGKLVGGTGRFIRRRAWRILPAYWAALVVSTVVLVVFLDPNADAQPVARSFILHGVMLQDAFEHIYLNGTFWSIAVEWWIYFAFPLILLVAQRRGMLVAVVATAIAVIGSHLLGETNSLLAKIDHLSPQFLVLFAFGVLAAAVAHGERPRISNRVASALMLAACAATVALAIVQGSAWMSEHWFWVDMVAGVAVANGLLLATRSRGRWRGATLGSRPAMFVGKFSYSLYLVHVPLLGLAYKYVLQPLDLSPLMTFASFVILVLPAILVATYGFFVIFERPFLTRRDFASLRTLPPAIFVSRRLRSHTTTALAEETAR